MITDDPLLSSDLDISFVGKLFTFARPEVTDDARQDYVVATQQLMMAVFAFALDVFNGDNKFAEYVLRNAMITTGQVVTKRRERDEEWRDGLDNIVAITMTMLMMAYKSSKIGPFVEALLKAALEGENDGLPS